MVGTETLWLASASTNHRVGTVVGQRKHKLSGRRRARRRQLSSEWILRSAPSWDRRLRSRGKPTLGPSSASCWSILLPPALVPKTWINPWLRGHGSCPDNAPSGSCSINASPCHQLPDHAKCEMTSQPSVAIVPGFAGTTRCDVQGAAALMKPRSPLACRQRGLRRIRVTRPCTSRSIIVHV